MNSLFQIDIPKRTLSCCDKGERLLPGMEYYSLLYEDGNKKIARKDFCSRCWNQGNLKETFADNRGHWKSKVEIKKDLNPSSRIERALLLLKSYIANQKDHENELFVLAMYLAHARRLAFRQDIEQDGIKYGLYEILRDDEFVTIKTIPLTQLEISSIQTSLAEKLK